MEAEVALRRPRFDRAELSIREVALAVGRGELDAVAGRERAVRLSIERHALKPSWIVGDATARSSSFHASANDRETDRTFAKGDRRRINTFLAANLWFRVGNR
jgi:hypothetical protein